MYHEEIGDLTAEHLREHIPALLELLMDRYGDSIQLEHPKAVETANLVGGVYNATQGSGMPAYAVDVIEKTFSEVNSDLWIYNYSGHIAGIISASSEETANRIVKRHEQAAEMFVKSHEHFHQTSAKIIGNDFTIVGLGFSDASFSGAELLDEKDSRQLWIAGFRIDLIWVVSEDGPSDHA